MQVEIVDTGYYNQNCYILSKDNNVLIVDPGAKSKEIIETVANRKVLAILITHHHFDHVGAVSELVKHFSVPVIDKYDSNVQKLASFTFEIIATPGHSEDSLTFYFPEDKTMFTGDFLFKLSIGRTDFPGSSPKQMEESLNKIKTYPDDTIIYPGHEEASNLAYEKNNNPYLS